MNLIINIIKDFVYNDVHNVQTIITLTLLGRARAMLHAVLSGDGELVDVVSVVICFFITLYC